MLRHLSFYLKGILDDAKFCQNLQAESTFFVNKTNRLTELQLYLYYFSTGFGQPFCPSSGVISRISALVHFIAAVTNVCYQE